MRYAVGQLTVGQILDQSLRLFMNRPGLYLGISGILYAPILLFQALANRAVGYQPEPGATQEEIMAGTMESGSTVMVITFVFLAVYFLLSGPLLSASITYAVKREYMDEEVTVKESLLKALSKLWPVLYTGVISGIFIILGFILCFIPGIYLMFRYYLAQQVVVLEDRKGIDALNRSAELMKGSYGIAFVMGFLAWIVTAMASGISILMPIPYVSDILTVLIQAAVVTVFLVAAVVLYFHCRARNENYDLQLLAESVGNDSAESSQVPPPLPSAE